MMKDYSKEDTEVAREEITGRLQRYMQEEGYHLSESSRYSHSLDSFLFQYQNKKFIDELMILTSQEKKYLNAFEGKEYKPELLFADEKMLENIKEHPMAVWKMEQRS